MKKGLSLFLSLIMVLGVLTSIPLTVNAASGSEIVAYARQFIGYPYVWGTQGPDSFDCSGFVQYVFKHFGISLPASSSSYWNNPEDYGTVIATGTTANAQAGDLISWSGHIAIYTENGYCVEALNPTYGVCEKFKVDSHTNGLNYKVIRVNGVENYTEPPVAPTVYLNKNILQTNETATLYWDSCDRTEYYWISCWSETEQCISEESHSLSKEISFSSPGKYSITVVSGNSKGESIGNWIDIEVYDTNGYNIIEYNANGGTGNMSSHNVYYNSIFSLKESLFKRTGYKQIGWNAYRNSDNKWFAYGIGWKTEEEIKQNGWSKSVYPNPIEKWTFDWSWYNEGIVNDTIVFYAVWEKVDTYTVTYNANGGSGAPSSQTKTYGQTLTLSNTKPTRSGYTFLGWATSSTATKATYSAGGSFTANADTTLYAVWQKNHSHSYTGTVTKAPTCTESGVKTFKCSCGTSYTQSISATGHIAGSWEIDMKATVNAAGSKHKECTECGEVLETAEIAQLKCSKPTLKSIENSEYGVLVKWGTIKGADKYYIYRKVKGGSYSRIGSTTKTYYTDKTAKSGKKYYYIVKAINEAGASSSSSSLSKLYLADPTLKTPTSTKSGVSLKWTKTAGAEGYIIYRKTGSGSYTKLKTEKGVSNLSYVDKSAKKGKKYTYKVKAYYSKTYSAYSNTKSITDKY